MKAFFVLQLSTLLSVFHLLAITLIEDYFRISSNQYQNSFIIFCLFFFDSLQKYDFIRKFIDRFDVEHLFDKKVTNTRLSHCIFIFLQVEVLLCSLLYSIIIVRILFERCSCICLRCGEQCNLHKILHRFDIFDADGFCIYAAGHKVVVDFFDSNRV